MQVIFWTKIISAVLLIAGIHLTAKREKAYKQANNYFLHLIKCTLFIWRIRADKTF